MNSHNGRSLSRSRAPHTPRTPRTPRASSGAGMSSVKPIVLAEDPGAPMELGDPAGPSTMAPPPYPVNDYHPCDNDRLLTAGIVVVSVGPEQEKTSVHMHLLTSMSPYFHRLITQAEQSGQDGNEIEIQVLETDPKLFKMFLHWLYGTAFGNTSGHRSFHFRAPDTRTTVRDYIGLYILGGTLEVPGLRNAALDTIYNYYAEDTAEVRCPDLEDVQYLFNNTAPTSHLRRLLIVFSLFHLFGKKRTGLTLPGDWQRVIEGGDDSGEVAWAMIQMISDWRWQMGHNCPPMKLKSRQTFHEEMPIPGLKLEEDDDGAGYASQAASRAESQAPF
ncbi:hypothetical protein B0T25DRAFT_304692 [Lasiosphaeria hispida]|uniref:BTB domain-containing protein n=1 Tax=Lasiosphaeria hispida TaxID=260671 RepID=A0AAJ0H8J5_9PEZI|nr:hypothetical protein B0T25DRAFT_304692 [Lasiosphaeria hispida]